VIRTPVSITYACTALPSSIGVYDWVTVAPRWSMRSRFQLGFTCV
jgi:hypothetical protein